jgi:xylulokinase
MILRSSERDDGAPYTEEEAKPVLKQLLSALACLHGNQICHRDLKPENILVVRADGASQDDVQLKISDFGLAADLDGLPDARMTEAYGSPEYAAPEIGGPAGYGVEVDIWSLGVISFMMLTGVLPYESDDPGTLRRKVKNLTVDAVFKQTADLWEIVSTEAQVFVKLMLAKDAAHRAAAAELLVGQYLDPSASSAEEGEPPEADSLRKPVAPVVFDTETDPELRGSFKSSKSGASSPRSARSQKRLSSMRGQVSYTGCDLPDDADIIVSVDIGMTGAKAVLTLIGRAREELGYAFEKYETGTTTSKNGMFVEQQPEDWWNAFVSVTRRLLVETGVVGAEPRLSSVVICLSGQMQDMILVAADQPNGVRPAILARDTQAQIQVKDVDAQVGRSTVQTATDHYEGAESCLAKWLWLQQEAPGDLAKTDAILFGAHSYIAWRLSGKAVCDLTTASTTGLLDKTSAKTGYRWCHGLLADRGIVHSERLLPTLESASSVCTKITDEMVEMLGLEHGSWADDSYVVSGSGSLGAATVGAGGGIAGATIAHLGSSGWLAQSLSVEEALVNPPAAGVAELLHPDPSLIIRTVSMCNAGDVVEWLADTEFASAAHAQHKHEVFASIDTTARTAPAGSNGLIFLPYLSGERLPASDPAARGVYFGLSHETGKPERYRATLEGVAFAYRSLFEMLCENHCPLCQA